MTDKRKPQPGQKPKVEKLELNKETVQELTEGEAEAAEGGQVFRPRTHDCQTPDCPTAYPYTNCYSCVQPCYGPCAPGGPTAGAHAARRRRRGNP